ncbi:uncharacterized protein [Epargyreus clarus]|uniref:uncharacterized protein isoform X2 n=1 Tax=Epargyreus clarus TaxID=520877 RepID=UPI003C2CDD7F
MGFELPRLYRFCFCLSLRTGALIIGYLSLLNATLNLFAVSFSLYKVVTFIKTNGSDINHTPEETANIALGLYVSHAYSLLIFLYYFVISLLLIIGVHKNRVKLMKYYYYTGLFLLGLALALVVVATIFLNFAATLSLLAWCVILFYCLLVVRSTYLEIEERIKPPAQEMQTLYITQQAPLIV